MPSHPLDTGWDFGPVLDLIDSDTHQLDSQALVPGSLAAVGVYNTKSTNQSLGDGGGISLGNFGRLFQELGISDDELPPQLSPVEPESDGITSDDTLLPPPRSDPGDINNLDDHVKPGPSPEDSQNSLPVELSTKDPYEGMTKKQRHQARKRAEKERKTERQRERQQQEECRQREQVLEGLRKLAHTSLPNVPTPENSTGTLPKQPSKSLIKATKPETSSSNQSTKQTPASKQARARSNVGAKIRPATPVELDSSVRTEDKPADVHSVPDTVVMPVPISQPADSVFPRERQLSFHAQPFMSGLAEHPSLSNQHGPGQSFSPTVVKLNSTLTAQYTAFGTPVPYQHSVSPAILSQMQSNSYFQPQFATPQGHSYGLVPRTVQPVVLQRPVSSVPHSRPSVVPVTPIRQPTFMNGPTIRPQLERHFHFLNKLMHDFPEDRKHLVAPMQLCNERTASEGIHVFVDASNIMIGFRDSLREHSVDSYEMSFDSLALLMERRRPVAKRVFAGSHREANPLPHVTRLAETSKAVGYENNVKEQVFIRREDTDKKKFFKDVKRLGWTKAAQRRSGSGSDTEMGPDVSATPSAPKWVEQGVDEILHLKMCQSIIDIEAPTTMILATGDGAEAEHSDGFLAHVERALRKGWKVELVSWRQQTSGGYKNKKFRAKWGENFRIIELDDYLESLIDTP